MEKFKKICLIVYINTCVIEPKLDMRFRRKMDKLRAEETTPEE